MDHWFFLSFKWSLWIASTYSEWVANDALSFYFFDANDPLVCGFTGPFAPQFCCFGDDFLV